MDMFGARYATGEAAHLRFAGKTHARIRNRFGLGENVKVAKDRTGSMLMS